MKTKGDYAGKICVVVGTVTDDLRLYEVPPLKVRLFADFSVFSGFHLHVIQKSVLAKFVKLCTHLE